MSTWPISQHWRITSMVTLPRCICASVISKKKKNLQYRDKHGVEQKAVFYILNSNTNLATSLPSHRSANWPPASTTLRTNLTDDWRLWPTLTSLQRHTPPPQHSPLLYIAARYYHGLLSLDLKQHWDRLGIACWNHCTVSTHGYITALRPFVYAPCKCQHVPLDTTTV
jgi:hypothetical protein